VIVSVSNKEMWNDVREVVPSLVHELAGGSAELIQEEAD